MEAGSGCQWLFELWRVQGARVRCRYPVLLEEDPVLWRKVLYVEEQICHINGGGFRAPQVAWRVQGAKGVEQQLRVS